MSISSFVSGIVLPPAIALAFLAIAFVDLWRQRGAWRARAIDAEETILVALLLTNRGDHDMADTVLRKWKASYEGRLK